MTHILRCAAVMLLLMGTVVTSPAQDGRGVSVTERPRPDYDALGIRAGAFLIRPELKLGLEYNDNIYATKDRQTSDAITVIAPQADVRSDWSRHALGASAGLNGGMYWAKSDENYLDGHLRLDARLDVLRTSYLDLRLGSLRGHEERGDPEARPGDKNPGVYYSSVADLQYYHGLGKLSVRGGGGFTNYMYESVDQLDGSTREPGDTRDRNNYNANLRLAYELLPNVRPFIEGRYEWRRYAKSEARRDSDGYRIGAGTGLDLGGVITGEIYAGYMHQDYKDSGRDNISAPWYGLALLWNVTPLTSVQGRVEKSVKETTRAGASGIDALDAGLRLDHELLRNLLVGGFFDFTRDDYSGISNVDTYYTLGPRLTYLWNRNLSADMQYAHKIRDAQEAADEYQENRFSVSVTGKF